MLRLQHYLRDTLPNTQILLMALLPRGNWGVYAPAMHLINAHFKCVLA